MKRNLRFWTRYTWETMGVELGATVLLAVLALFGADGLDWSFFASTVPLFLCISAMFGIVMINSGSQSLYVPLLISMGETRRNVFWGFHYFRALVIAVTLALCALIWLAAPGEVSTAGLRSLPTLLCVLAAVSALGSIMGTIFTRWRWAGMILIIIICGGGGGMLGATGAIAANGGFSQADTLMLVSYLMKTPWWLAAAALAAVALDAAFQWVLLRKQEVRL